MELDIEKLVSKIIKDGNLNEEKSDSTEAPKTSAESSGTAAGESGVFKTVEEAVKAAKVAQNKYFHTSLKMRKKNYSSYSK